MNVKLRSRLAQKLDGEIAAVATHVRQAWTPGAAVVTRLEVLRAR